jgi:hypothetical protein
MGRGGWHVSGTGPIPFTTARLLRNGQAAQENPDAECDEQEEAADVVFKANRVILQMFNRVDCKDPGE